MSVVSIVVIKIWKREAQKRTDSFRAIEHSLEMLGYSVMDYLELKNSNLGINIKEDVENHDMQANNIEQVSQSTEQKHPEQEYGEINFDFLEELNQATEQTTEQISERAPEQISNQTSEQTIETPISYDVGRSGKKYTATELETLIKE